MMTKKYKNKKQNNTKNNKPIKIHKNIEIQQQDEMNTRLYDNKIKIHTKIQ